MELDPVSELIATRAKRYLKAGFLFVLGFFATFQCRAQQTGSQPEEVKDGTITGRVVNENGQPLVGAIVTVRLAAGMSLGGRTAQVNTEGSFKVVGLDTGLYVVTAGAPAYITPSFDGEADTQLYRVGDSVRLQLVRGGVITGTVSNDNGEPLVGIRARAVMIKDATGRDTKFRFSVSDRQTDDRGSYRIYGLQAGTYLVSAGGGGPQYVMNSAELDAPTYAPSSSRDTAAEIQVRGGEEALADIRYRFEQGHTISGTVKALGNNGVSVSLVRVDGSGGVATTTAFQPQGVNTFTLFGLSDGDYLLTATEILSPPGRDRTEFGISDPVKVSVKGSDVSGVELVPKALATISGRIVLESSKLLECSNKKEPLLNETVIGLVQNRKELDTDPSLLIRAFNGSTAPDKDWSFAIKNLRPGQYAFTPRFFARYWYLKSMSVAIAAQPITRGAATAKDVTRDWTNLKSSEKLTGLTITLSQGAASVRGQVAKSDSKFDSGLRVYLVPAERDKPDDPLRYFTTLVADDGTFFLTSVPPGKYSIFTQQSSAGVPANSDLLHLPDALEARTRLRRAGEAVKSQVELRPCQNLPEITLTQR